MEIISHRGYWKEVDEKNTIKSFKSSFLNNIGTETDVRDYVGELVISHDIANSTCITLKTFFESYIQIDNSLTLALNIKADGLALKLKELIINYNIENYFVFDMSIPDTLSYIQNGIKIYTRQSEFEPIPAFYEFADGVWLDSFGPLWYEGEVINNHITNNKRVAIVSSDLHKRDNKELWELLKKNNFHKNKNILLCTDMVDDANKYFIN